jgi:hypothetical protein
MQLVKAEEQGTCVATFPSDRISAMDLCTYYTIHI